MSAANFTHPSATLDVALDEALIVLRRLDGASALLACLREAVTGRITDAEAAAFALRAVSRALEGAEREIRMLVGTAEDLIDAADGV